LGNLRLKLIALFFAVALWSVVAYTSNPTQSQRIPMSVIPNAPVPAGLVVVGAVPQVTVTVIGTADNLHSFDPHQLRVTGNFANVHVGKNQVPIRVDNSDSSVQTDAPKTIPVTVDQRASASLPVSIERQHALLPGFHEPANSAGVNPATVQVDGPKSLLSGIQAVVVINLDGVSAPGTTQTIPVFIRDSAKKDITKSFSVTPPNVTVKITIQADAITLDKPVGFTLTGQPAAGFRVSNVTVAPLQVQATGLQNALGGIAVLSTDPVDIGNAKSDVVKIVTIRPPDGVSATPKTVTVHVYISAIPGASPTTSP
jgi:YbbR domain-containing protein